MVKKDREANKGSHNGDVYLDSLFKVQSTESIATLVL